MIAHQAARILKEEFGAGRVVVFGSLLHPERFHLRSDIDLGVWDIQSYFRAVSRLMDIDPAIEFDLVPVEDARPGILAVIEQESVLLIQKKSHAQLGNFDVKTAYLALKEFEILKLISANGQQIS